VIDPLARCARVQPGVTPAELEQAAFRWGLAPLVDPDGFVPANLIAARVVLPDGELVVADAELLREIRTDRALGIVVDATYRLHLAADLRR
jgi:FAD/FMN-containing dehydrogenase